MQDIRLSGGIHRHDLEGTVEESSLQCHSGGSRQWGKEKETSAGFLSLMANQPTIQSLEKDPCERKRNHVGLLFVCVLSFLSSPC